jgi:alanine racemase
MFILNKIREIKKSLSRHSPLIEIFIYKDRLLHNLKTFQSTYPKLKFAPVLKSNAYGHGLKEVLRALKGQNLPFVALDSYFEARLAKTFSPEFKVLVIDYSRLEDIKRAGGSGISFAITSFEQLEELSVSLKHSREFHLKVDTGLHRQGIHKTQYALATKLILANPNIRITGLFSHLAEAENKDETQTLKQVEEWNEAVKYFKNQFASIEYWHLAASAGARFSDRANANLGRLGIGLYGFDVARNGLNLKPALKMVSVVTGIKKLAKGDKVGYGLTFEALGPLTAATVPVGYFEGVDRELSGKGAFKIRGINCPILGRVSMNITSINASEVADLKLEDGVEIISPESKDINSVENIANLCNTIPYVILVHIPPHLKRTLV